MLSAQSTDLHDRRIAKVFLYRSAFAAMDGGSRAVQEHTADKADIDIDGRAVQEHTADKADIDIDGGAMQKHITDSADISSNKHSH